MTHQFFLNNKETLQKALYDAMLKTLENMPLEEIKKISWFNSASYDELKYKQPVWFL